MSSSLLELFGGGLHGGAGSPNVVKEEIGGIWVDGDFRVQSVRGFGLTLTGGF